MEVGQLLTSSLPSLPYPHTVHPIDNEDSCYICNNLAFLIVNEVKVLAFKKKNINKNKTHMGSKERKVSIFLEAGAKMKKFLRLSHL